MARFLAFFIAAVLGAVSFGGGAGGGVVHADAGLQDSGPRAQLAEAQRAYSEGLAARHSSNVEPLSAYGCLAVWTLTGRDLLGSQAVYAELGLELDQAERHWRHHLAMIQRRNSNLTDETFIQNVTAARDAQLEAAGQVDPHLVILERTGRCTVETSQLRVPTTGLRLMNFLVQTGQLPAQFMQTDEMRQARMQTLTARIDVCAGTGAAARCYLGSPMPHSDGAGMFDAQPQLIEQCVAMRGLPIGLPVDVCEIDSSAAENECMARMMRQPRQYYTYAMNCEMVGG